MGHGLFFWVVAPLPFVVFGVCWLLFELAIGIYWFGAVLFFFWCVVAAGLIAGVMQNLWIERIENPLPSVTVTSNISLSVTSILILVTICAWLSYMLGELGLTHLSDSSAVPSYGNIIKTYTWHLIDLIPLMNVEKTFGMKNPAVQFTGWIAGAPILFFRFLVVIIIFNVIREAWAIFLESSRNALIERIKKELTSEGKRNMNTESSTASSE